jgi:hypothetical protein
MGGNPAIGVGLGAFGAGLGFGINSYLGTGAKFFPRLAAAAFTGAIVGGVGSVANGGKFGMGAAYGAGFGAAGFSLGYGIGKGFEIAHSSAQHRAIAAEYEKALEALTVDQNDKIEITVGSRPLAGDDFGNPGDAEGLRHRYIRWQENGQEQIWEMGPQKGIITTRNTATEGWPTAKTTNISLSMGSPVSLESTVSLSLVGLKGGISTYESYWARGNVPYNKGSYNSNYAVNSVVYGAGGNVPENLGYSPGFPDSPSRR